MPGIIGTIFNVKDFLGRWEASVYREHDATGLGPIVLEADRAYVVPDFQREIRWSEENVIELISDIKRGEQFLGNIILSKRPNKKYEIIDGQQRLSTLLMLLQYIRYVSKGSVPVFDTCDFYVDSFGQFPLALSVNFDIESQTQSVKETVQESDIFNQLPRYRELWKAIDESGDVDRGTCRVFLQNLSRCTLNVLLDISAEGIGYSIQYFLDVNLKGIRLDTEDILKSYLFSYDQGTEIRDAWKKVKISIFRLEKRVPKYSLIKVVEQFLLCDLYKDKTISDSGIRFTEKFLLKYPKTLRGVKFKKNDHIVKVIDDSSYFLSAFQRINEYLELITSIADTDGIDGKFKDLFEVNGNKLLQNNEIKVIHNLLKKVILDDNVVPKILIMRYLLDMLYSTMNVEKIRRIYGVYALSVLFTVFDDKRSSSQITDIVRNVEWFPAVIRRVNAYLHSTLAEKRLSAKYTIALFDSHDSPDDGEVSNEELLEHSSYQYRTKSLATLFGYFRLSKDDVKIVNIDSLNAYLNDDVNYTAEHFILNKSGKYSIPNVSGLIPYPKTASRFNESLFNFIFVHKDLNGQLGELHIGDKIKKIEDDGTILSCEYSKIVLNAAKKCFGNKPDNTDGTIEEEKKQRYSDYYENEFKSDFASFADLVIAAVFKQFKLSN